MKKLLGIVLVVLMVLGLSGMAVASTTGTVELTIKIKVLPWVMARPCARELTIWLDPMPQDIGVLPAQTFGPIEDFYANLPVDVTISGNNPAGDGFPQFAREELNMDGTGRGLFDRLSTHIVITTHVNAFLHSDPNYASFVTEFHAANVRPSGIKEWKDNVFTLPTPHDGEVWEEFSIYADRMPPKWEIDNDYARSADAGVYELTLKKTLVANTGTAQTPFLP